MKECTMALDVVAVSDSNGNIHSTEFHVNFELHMMEFASNSVLGIHTRRNHASQSKAFFTSSRTVLTNLQQLIPSSLEDATLPASRNQNFHFHPGHSPPIQQTQEIEPEWLDLFCNGRKCSDVAAFIGPDDLLTFLERNVDEKGVLLSHFSDLHSNTGIHSSVHTNVNNGVHAGINNGVSTGISNGSTSQFNDVQNPVSSSAVETDEREAEQCPLGRFTRSPCSATLKQFHLKSGHNKIVSKSRKSGVIAHFSVFLYEQTDKIIIMDVDGTVTKSDVRGYVESVYFGVYNYTHEGIVTFLNRLQETSKCHFLYLTSRPISHIKETRLLLQNARDEVKGKCLPVGPVFSNTETLMTAAYRELIAKNTVALKSSILLSISNVFERAANVSKMSTSFESILTPFTPFITPFLFGIGNKIADAIAYKMAGVVDGHILIINTSSNIRVWVDERVSATNRSTSIEDNQEEKNNSNIVDSHQHQTIKNFKSYSDPFLLIYLQRLSDKDTEIN